MSATKSKVDLSLDDIIKNNKKEQKGGKRNTRRVGGNAGIRKGQGVLKRRSVGTPKKRVILNRTNKNNNINQAGASSVNNAATRRLVNKLVKKALNQVTRAPKVGAVRNVVRGRRGGVRGRGQVRNNNLNRVSQRSRVIGRQPRIVNRSPITAISNRGGRGNRRGGRGNRVVMARREPANPIQAQLNFLRRQQNIQQRQIPIIQQQRQIPVRQIPMQRRSFPQRRQATRVIYVQQQRPQPVRRAQQIVYIREQQAPRRQFSRGGRRPQRRNNANPFYEPPNFLQRVPASNQSFGRGRGGQRFIEF